MEHRAPRVERGILHRLLGRWGGVDSGHREAEVIAVSSGKGGTGKSFFATNLAVALSSSGRRVTVVDCDFGLGNAHLLLGVNPRRTLQHVVAGEVAIEEVVQPTAFGPALVPAGSGISRLADLSEPDIHHLVAGFARLAASQDVLVLDTAAGISPQSLLTLLVARHVVLVTNPEIAALTDAYALIKCLARQPLRPAILIVVNRSPRGLGRQTFDKLANVAHRFAGCPIHYLGEIADDPAVTQRRLGQPPLMTSYPECETAQCILEIVRQLDSFTGGFHPRGRSAHEGMAARLRAQLGVRSSS